MEQANSKLDDGIARRENTMKIYEIQRKERLEGLEKPGRTLVREGVLQKVCRRGPKPFRFYLFTDMLLYCGDKLGRLSGVAGTSSRELDLKDGFSVTCVCVCPRCGCELPLHVAFSAPRVQRRPLPLRPRVLHQLRQQIVCGQVCDRQRRGVLGL